MKSVNPWLQFHIPKEQAVLGPMLIAFIINTSIPQMWFLYHQFEYLDLYLCMLYILNLKQLFCHKNKALLQQGFFVCTCIHVYTDFQYNYNFIHKSA